MRARFHWLLVLAFLLGWIAGELHAEEYSRSTSFEVPPVRCVHLHLRPQVLISLGDVDVQVRVARHADHRALVVSWDSDRGFAGSRTFDLAGDHDRALFQWWNRDQPAAHYVYEARVFNAAGRSLDVDRKEIQTIEATP